MNKPASSGVGRSSGDKLAFALRFCDDDQHHEKHHQRTVVIGMIPNLLSNPNLRPRNDIRNVHDAVEEISLSHLPGVVVVHGDPGVGKSTVVAQVLLGDSASLMKNCRIATVLWINVLKISSAPRFDEPKFTNHLMDMLVKAKQISTYTDQNKHKDKTGVVRKASLRESLANCGKVLIILDDVVNPYTLQFVARLGPQVRCIAVSRFDIGHVVKSASYAVKSVRVDRLPDPTIKQILLEACDENEKVFDAAQLPSLVQLCQGLPTVAIILSNMFKQLTTKFQIDTVYEHLVRTVDNFAKQASLKPPMVDGTTKSSKIVDYVLMFLLDFKLQEFRSSLYTFLLYCSGEYVPFDDLLLLWRNVDPEDVRKRCLDLTAALLVTEASPTMYAINKIFYNGVVSHAIKRNFLGSTDLSQLKTRMIERALQRELFLYHAVKQRRTTLLQIILREASNKNLVAKRSLEVETQSGQSVLHLLAMDENGWIEGKDTGSERNIGLEMFCYFAQIAAVEQVGILCTVFMLKDTVVETSIFSMFQQSPSLRKNVFLIAARLGCSHLLSILADFRLINFSDSDDTSGDNALAIAASNGYRGLVRYLLETNKMDINAVNKRGETALNKSIRLLSSVDPTCCYHVAKQLMKAPELDVNLPDNLGVTPLFTAARNGHLSLVSLLLDQPCIDINQCEKNGESALMAALLNSNLEIAALLREKGASLSKFQSAKVKKLSNYKSKSREIQQFLLRCDEKPLTTSQLSADETCSPVHSLLRSGDHRSLSNLFEQPNNVDLEATDSHGDTPLAYACSKGLVKEAVMLIHAGASLKNLDPYGNSALMIASSSGLKAIVELLLRLGASHEWRNKYGDTALIFAAKEGHSQVGELLVRCGADIEAANSVGCTPIILAAANGRRDFVEMLVRFGANVEVVDQFHCSALMYASQNGHGLVIELLLYVGADAGAADKAGFTPLHAACLAGHVEVVSLLANSSACVEAQDQFGNTPLMLASQNGHLQVVEILSEKYKAKLGVANTFGDSAVILASSNGHRNVVEYLLKSSADIDAVNQLGNTALHASAWKGHLNVVQLLLDIPQGFNNLEQVNQFGHSALAVSFMNGQVDVANLLLEAGAVYLEPQQHPCGHSSLHWAAWKGQTEVVALLLKIGACLESRDGNGNTPLIMAAAGGSGEAAKLLADAGAALNAVNSVGNSALIVACLYQRSEVAEWLIMAGANVRLKNGANMTALSIARQKGLSNIVSILRGQLRQETPEMQRLVDTNDFANDDQFLIPALQMNNSTVLPDMLYAALYVLNATINAK